MAVASLVLGLIGLLGVIPILGWFFILFNVLAVIFGFVGMKKGENKGMAIAGLIMGAIPIGLKVITWALLALGVMVG